MVVDRVLGLKVKSGLVPFTITLAEEPIWFKDGNYFTVYPRASRQAPIAR
jgi:hypothetical protein